MLKRGESGKHSTYTKKSDPKAVHCLIPFIGNVSTDKSRQTEGRRAERGGQSSGGIWGCSGEGNAIDGVWGAKLCEHTGHWAAILWTGVLCGTVLCINELPKKKQTTELRANRPSQAPVDVPSLRRATTGKGKSYLPPKILCQAEPHLTCAPRMGPSSTFQKLSA